MKRARRQQHSKAATQHKNNMVAIQHMVQRLLGKVNSTKGQEGRDNNTSYKAATTVSKSVHDRVFE